MSHPFDRMLHLGDIESDGEQIAPWPHVNPSPDVRLHYKPSGSPGNGFKFCCVQEQGSDEDGDVYEVLFRGVAYFDGVRHLHFIGFEAGYFNYPNLDKLCGALKALQELERQHCPYLSL